MKYTRLKSAFIVAELFALAVCVSIWSTSCRTVQPVVDDVTHIAADCGKPAVRHIALRILDDVTTALVTADYAGGIRDVVARLVTGVASAELSRAKDEAWQAASCAVAEVRDQAVTHLGYARRMDEATIERETMVKTHADRWLEAHR